MVKIQTCTLVHTPQTTQIRGVNFCYKAAGFKLGYEPTKPSGATVKVERPFGLNCTITDDRLSCRIKIGCNLANVGKCGVGT
jgi:hypothetical protein